MRHEIVAGSRFALANIVPLLCAVGIVLAFFGLNWWQTDVVTVTGADITFRPQEVVGFVAETNERAIASHVLVIPDMPRIAGLGIVLLAGVVAGALALFSMYKVELGNVLLSLMNVLGALGTRLDKGITRNLERTPAWLRYTLGLPIMIASGLVQLLWNILSTLLRMPFESHTGRSVGMGIAVSSLVIWVYYLVYLTQNITPDETFFETIERVMSISGTGFSIIFIFSLGLVAQFFFPRASVEYYTAPWWLVLLFLLWVMVVILIPFNDAFNAIYSQLQAGIGLTLYLAIMSYIIAIIIGLLTGIVRSNRPQPPAYGMRFTQRVGRALHSLLYNLVTLYVEFMRGIPPLVFLLIAGFIIVPAVRDAINASFLPFLRDLLNHPDIPDLVWRGRDEGTAIAGLSLVYGAFLSEVFRAGIQSVEKGQVEAAKSLGMSYFQVMRYIVVPQAVRRMLPPLGNNFISIVKDTSLVTILGTSEITQIARRWSGSTFLYLETYMVLSLIYLTMTISGSLMVQLMERQLKQYER